MQLILVFLTMVRGEEREGKERERERERESKRVRKSK